MNRKILEMFGYDSQDDFIKKPAYGTVHPDDRAMVVEYNRKRQKGEPIPPRYEFRGIKTDGTIIFIEVTAIVIMYHEEPYALAYFRDITERKLTANNLQRTRLLLETVLEQSLVIRKKDGKIRNEFNENKCDGLAG
jgi:PAS domain S-box-containing protein